MSSEVSLCDSVYFNFQSRPKINKNKIQDLVKKRWDIPSLDFHENKLKEKNMPVFVLEKRRALSEDDKQAILSKNFLRSTCQPVKKQLVPDTKTISNTFVPICKESLFYHAIPITHKMRVQKKNLKTENLVISMENDFYGRASLHSKKPNICSLSYKSPDFQNILKQKNTAKVYKRTTKPMNDNFMESFLSEFIPTTPTSEMKETISFNTSVIQSELNQKESCSANFNAPDACESRKNPCFRNRDLKFQTLRSFQSSHTSLDHGSNWIQSIQWSTEEYLHTDQKDKIVKILLGGFSEKILKLKRREQYERAISEHSGSTKNEETIIMTISSVICMDDIMVVAKCSVSNEGNISETPAEVSEQLDSKDFHPKTNPFYMAVFQRGPFCRQFLKCGKSFSLSQPWHLLHLKSVPFPVIFCLNFKNITPDLPTPEKMMTQESERFKKDIKTSKCKSGRMDYVDNLRLSPEEEIFSNKWKAINLMAQIQRIWKRTVFKENSRDFSKNKECQRFSLLLLSKQKLFYELIVPACYYALLPDWQQCIRNGEGMSYVFSNLSVSHRLSYKRYPKFFNYLKTLLKHKVDLLKQDFVYQLIVDKFSRVVCEIEEPSFPVGPLISIQTLAHLQRSLQDVGRFSCQSKVLYQYMDTLYITDDSLIRSEDSSPYVKVLLLKGEKIDLGSTIFIKDSIISNGCLLLDEYSQISRLVPPRPSVESVDLHLTDLKIPLKNDSRETDIVSVEGKIINVHESEACSWLQCNLCLKDDLVQDSFEIIYCKDCCQVVTKPLLNLKMTVTIISQESTDALLNIQLLSPTIKKILHVGENCFQPQCCISDVLNQRIGPLMCVVKGDEVVADKRLFYLKEVPH